MKRQPMGDEPEAMGVLEHPPGHVRRTAEFARQRPFRARAVAQDAAEHFSPRGGARDLLDLRLAINRKEADPERIGAGDVLFLLDRVAEADAVGRRPRGDRQFDLGQRGGVETRTEPGEQIENLRGRDSP